MCYKENQHKLPLTCDRNVKGTYITCERNVWWTDITCEKNVQGTDSCLQDGNHTDGQSIISRIMFTEQLTRTFEVLVIT